MCVVLSRRLRCSHLIDGLRVRNGVRVFDDRHGLAGQDRLINAQGRRQDLDQSQVSRNLVANCTHRMH